MAFDHSPDDFDENHAEREVVFRALTRRGLPKHQTSTIIRDRQFDGRALGGVAVPVEASARYSSKAGIVTFC